MKLWLLSQTEADGYDTYDSAVVAAETELEARHIVPGDDGWEEKSSYPSWATKPENVSVQLIGTALAGTLPGVIVASFNAG